MTAYYNDSDEFCCRWLEHLIAADAVPTGIVDNRRITFANYVDLATFRECHFFAGIGGWPLALRLAQWPRDEPVWTGSCPCQPFSGSNQNRERTADERHLWPDFFQLIEKHRPTTIFGEQVASPDGRAWLSDVRNDLQRIGYAVGAANLSARLVGAKHDRRRLFWVADANGARLARLKPARENLRGATSPTSAEYGLDRLRSRFYDPADPVSVGSYHGISRPVDIVRAIGNAIVPQVGALFIRAFMES